MKITPDIFNQFTYLTQDNGGFHYKVTIDSGVITIYKIADGHIENIIRNWIAVYPGIDNRIYNLNYKLDGNSLIINLDNHIHLFVGYTIKTFKIQDEIEHYYSPTGNSDVPYPYLICRKNTYLMLEDVYIKNEDKKTLEPYEQYYNHENKYQITHTGKF